MYFAPYLLLLSNVFLLLCLVFLSTTLKTSIYLYHLPQHAEIDLTLHLQELKHVQL